MNNDTSSLAVLKSHSFLMEALDAKQKIYVDARAMGSVPVVAARVAGFPDPEATALVIERDPTIKMAVEAAIRVYAREASVTRRDVEEGLKDAVRMAANSTELRQAWRELGQLHGYYDQKTKVEIGGAVELIHKQMKTATDDDLAKLAVLDGDYQVLDFEEEETGAIARLES